MHTICCIRKDLSALFGNKGSIRYINNDKESDVIVTHDDGSRQMVRYTGFFEPFNGSYKRWFMFIFPFLQSFNESGYDLFLKLIFQEESLLKP